MIWPLALWALAFGLAIGSFLNVVIYRVPRNLSVVSPPSACPGCATPISPRDNIPVVSWLLLRGKCRTCAMAISPRYPLVEGATGLLFVGVVLRLGRSPAIPAYCILLAGLLALALIDLEFLRLPKRLVWIHLALVAGLLAAASAIDHTLHSLLVGALCALIWSGLFFLINLASPRLLGFGDVRLALVLGLSLGWLGAGSAALGFFLANLIGVFVIAGLMATKKMARNQQIPYGVFLAAGTAVTFYFGPAMLSLFPHLSN